jgi:rhodanese-related sulfurtransferase
MTKRCICIIGALVAAIAAIGLSVGCLQTGDPLAESGIESDLPEYGPIDPADAAHVIEAFRDAPDFLLLDVRTPAEVAAGHLSGATNLDWSDPSFREIVGEWDRDKTYLIYCRTGHRSEQARAAMIDLGFAKLYEVAGGINAWAELGFPVCIGPLDERPVSTVPSLGT